MGPDRNLKPNTNKYAWLRRSTEALVHWSNVPWLTASGLEKTRITNIFPIINEIIAERRKKIKTHELNEFLLKTLERKPFPLYRGKELKFLLHHPDRYRAATFRIFVIFLPVQATTNRLVLKKH